MSEENRPNLNAVGLTVDIITSIDKYRRGNAGKADIMKVVDTVRGCLEIFVEDINDILDLNFGEQASLDRNGN